MTLYPEHKRMASDICSRSKESSMSFKFIKILAITMHI